MARSATTSLVAQADASNGGEVVSPPLTFAPPNQRLGSLDALRGFTMFWLIGGRELILAVIACLYPPWFDAMETHLTHPKWQGYVVWDLVMPLFLFVVGAALPFAQAKRFEPGQSLGPAYWRIARRVVLLWVLGMIAQTIKYAPQGMELYSNALQAIALGYLITSLALLHLRVPGQIVLFAAILLGYWGLLMFVPFAGHPGGTLEPNANFARYIDELVLAKARRDHNFTWVITSLGFASTVLLGAMAGHLLRAHASAGRKIFWLTGIGSACIAGGWVWSYSIPLNRHLWTSSMILWAGGWSFLLLALFYAVIDVAGIRRWAFPFVVIGSNALLAYILDPAFEEMGDTVVLFLIYHCPKPYLDLLSALIEISLLWLILWYLHRNRLFFRA